MVKQVKESAGVLLEDKRLQAIELGDAPPGGTFPEFGHVLIAGGLLADQLLLLGRRAGLWLAARICALRAQHRLFVAASAGSTVGKGKG